MSYKPPKIAILLILFLVSIISVQSISTIIASSYAISNFDVPILQPYQARYTQPWVGQITFIFSYATVAQEYDALKSGKIDFTGLNQIDLIQDAIQHYNNTIFVGIAPVTSFEQIVFSFNQSYITSNIYFRYAVSSLIDPNQITKLVWGNGILGVDYPYFVSPKIFSQWFNPEVVQYYQKYQSYNVTRAIQYLEKIPGVQHINGKWYYKGQPLTLSFMYVPGNVPLQNLANYLKTQFESINITLNLVQLPFGQILAAATSPPYSFNMTVFGWINLGPLVPFWLTIYTTPENVGGFSNDTINELIMQAQSAPTLAQSIELTKKVELYLQQQLPYVIIGWLNSVQGVYLPGWANYIYMSNGTNVYAVVWDNVHPKGSALTGNFIASFISGTLPRYINPYASTTLYEFNVLGELYAPLYTTPYPEATVIPPLSHLIPVLASNFTVKYGFTGTAPNGKLIVNGSIVIIKLVHNATWIDGYPVTADDFNFTIWYYDIPGISGTNTFEGLHVNYTYLIDTGQINGDFFGTIPQIVYSNATDPYTLVVYLNSSNIMVIEQVLGLAAYFPAHIYNKIQPSSIFTTKFAPLISDGPYIWNGSINSFSQEAFPVVANVHYPRINPLIFLQNVTQGTPYNFTTTFTYYTWNNATGTVVPSPATGTAYVWLVALNVSGVKYGNYTKPIQMTQIGPGKYSALISTSNLPPGIYEVVAKIVSPDGRMEYSYGSINVLPAATSTTSTSSTITTSTTTTGAPVALYVGIAIVIIIIIVAAVLLLRRR